MNKTCANGAVENNTAMETETVPNQVTSSLPFIKAPKVKASPAVKRLRKSMTLSKSLAPRSPIQILNELCPTLQYEDKQNVIITSGISCFTVTISKNGKCLGMASGKSKSDARSAAAEAVLKDIVRGTLKTEQVMDEPEDAESSGGTDDYHRLPWGALASLALYQMFEKWQEEGIPIPRQNHGIGVEGKPELPANAAMMHPVSLLHQLYSVQGILPETVEKVLLPTSSVTMGYRINGQLYTGVANNAKKARKVAAKNALLAIYGLQFPD